MTGICLRRHRFPYGVRRIGRTTCLLVTFGLSHRVEDPRIAVAVEPYPNRWTHHVLISESDQIDAQLMAWLEEARTFARSKR